MHQHALAQTGESSYDESVTMVQVWGEAHGPAKGHPACEVPWQVDPLSTNPLTPIRHPGWESCIVGPLE